MRQNLRAICVLTTLLGLVLDLDRVHGAGRYDLGASDTEIKIGNTCPYSGPASAYGTICRAYASYFRKLNGEGGLRGRRIAFITYDDAFNPAKTLEHARRLVEQDKVLFLFQSLGDVPNSAIREYLNQQKVPQLFLGGGLSRWNDPSGHPWTIMWGSTYRDEARAYAHYIVQQVPEAKVGILYQNDDYGKDYLRGFKEALGGKAQSLIVSEQSYELTDPNVDSQIVNLKKSGATVFLDVTTPRFAAQAIRKAYELGWHPRHFLNYVAASPAWILPAGRDACKGLMTAYYGKLASDPQWNSDPGMRDYRAWMNRYHPEGDIRDESHTYAYLVLRTLMHVLDRAGDDLTRANIMRQATSISQLQLPLLLPGIEITTSPTDFRVIKQFRMAEFDGDRWNYFGPIIGRRPRGSGVAGDGGPIR
jgi:branched-chain amino acid transport system substrate-binding protein